MARKRNTESETRLAGASALPREKFKTTRSKHVTKSNQEAVVVTAIAADLQPVEYTAVLAPQSGVSYEEISALAYSYWVGRGCQGGSPEEDWLRAEAELRDRHP